MAVHFSKLRVKDIRRETDDCVSIAFEIPPALESMFRFKQGQNITIRRQFGADELRRSYSICSSPLDDELRIAVKKVTGGRFSTYANEKLIKGDELELLPPTGAFYSEVNAAQQKSYLAFAAGSGITPIMSLIRTVLATEPHSHFTLVYGNRYRSSIIFKEALDALKDRYMDRFALFHILSRETMDAQINQGRIDPEKCEALCEKLIDPKKADEIFLCGPADMIFSVKDWIEKQGVVPKKIHFELFNTPVKPPTTSFAGASASAGSVNAKPLSSPDGTLSNPGSNGAVSKVTIRLDGISFDFDLPYEGDAILDAALHQGADLPFACKGGVCCTCRARLKEGKVEMDTNYALESDEVAAGFILTCQSHPRTPRVVIDFDAK